MAFPTFSYTPEFGAVKTSKPTVTKIQFGDGYSQRLAYGINNQPESWGLTFANRDQAEADAIDAFLSARGGVDPFSWETPEGNDKNFICEEWTRSITAAGLFTITATFMEVFDPE